MSNAENLAACLEMINALPADQVLEPTIPVDVFVQEAENLYHWCQTDLAQLAASGFDAAKIGELNIRAGACREAQSLWVKERRSSTEWNERSPEAYEMRDELLHAFRYAFRNDAGLLGRVSEIADGAGHADMVQDLNDLSVLGKQHPGLLATIGFDPAKLDTAASLANEMADLLASVNGTRMEGNSAKAIRDRAYTYLKQLVDEVRACGKYVFWKNEKRRKGYYSDFWRKRNNQKTEPVPDAGEN